MIETIVSLCFVGILSFVGGMAYMYRYRPKIPVWMDDFVYRATRDRLETSEAVWNAYETLLESQHFQLIAKDFYLAHSWYLDTGSKDPVKDAGRREAAFYFFRMLSQADERRKERASQLTENDDAHQGFTH